ncbi:MAG: hypothetical protein DCC55_29930 [Chloroflexi bacterium]|nr:MAG: hypothetical protein DCC55_29930 [Chloroflexota bacterium]
MRLGSFQILVALLTAIAIQLPGIPSATAAPLPQDLPQAKAPSAAIELDLHHDGVSAKLRRIDFWDGYVVFVGTATTTNRSDCLLRSDFVLQLGDIRY